MRIAITGATGSLGGALIKALRRRPDVTRVVALSRDEVKSGDLADRYADFGALKCQLCDVRDEARLREVLRGCDAVVHAAALKRVSHSVYSPWEVVQTNVIGTRNVIAAATDVGVERIVVISSDKAVEPTNLYGVTKAAAETYAVQQNSYAVPRGTRISCVRYGNVLGSRGSVVGVWRAALRLGVPLALTHPEMTRFVITLEQAAAFVLSAFSRMQGGEVFVPALPACRVDDLATAVEVDWLARGGAIRNRGARSVVGLRPGGEKLHESLISREEPSRTWWACEGTDGMTFPRDDLVVLPSHHSWRVEWRPPGPRFEGTYSSDAVPALSVPELAALLEDVGGIL